MTSKRASKKKPDAKAKKPPGRPSMYSPEVAAKICELLVQGYFLHEIGEMDGMPAKRTIISWLVERDEFRHLYARAREAQALIGEDEIAEISDDARNDYVERTINGKKQTVFHKEHVMRSELRVNTRKWLMSKRMPKRYADKIDVNHSGEVGITDAMQQARERLRTKREQLQAEAQARLAAGAENKP